jgi:hypothetical protein
MVSGAFAKYVTSDSITDSARVAKFGVEVKASGSLFAHNYFAVGNENSNQGTSTTSGITVVSNGNDNVVAPGTKSADGITFSITGTPEVDVALVVDVNDDSLADVVLKSGASSYPDKTTGNASDTFTLSSDYHPIKYTLRKSGTSDALVDGGTLDALKTALEGLSKDSISANTTLDSTYTITWEWAFESNHDKEDTLLGDLAVNNALIGTDYYNLTPNFDLTISVTQID